MIEAVMEHDDEAELTDYIWEYYGKLMTEFEQQMSWADLARKKQAIGNTDTAQFILRRHGITGNPIAESILAEELDAFRRGVAQRLLRENRDQIVVNRCPACHRVARTPQARQCFRCGHDWHEGRG
jgi:hypothetical protein